MLSDVLNELGLFDHCDLAWRLYARWLRLTRNTHKWDLLVLEVLTHGNTQRLKWLRGLDVFWTAHEALYLRVAAKERSRDNYWLLLCEVPIHRIVPLRQLFEALIYGWLVQLEGNLANLTRDVLCRSPETSFAHQWRASDRESIGRVLMEIEAAPRLEKDGKRPLLPPKAPLPPPLLKADRDWVLDQAKAYGLQLQLAL